MARVLVVDDHEDSRELAAAILTAASHEVRAAADGAEALELYRQAPADVVVVDIFMPGMDGLQVIAKIRRDFPEARIIAMSAGLRIGGGDLLGLAREHGADAALRKPIDRAVLVQCVERLVDGR